MMALNQRYFEEHHQITEMALSLASWALLRNNIAGARQAVEAAKKQIEELRTSQGITQEDLDRFLAHLPLTKVEVIGIKPKPKGKR